MIYQQPNAQQLLDCVALVSRYRCLIAHPYNNIHILLYILITSWASCTRIQESVLYHDHKVLAVGFWSLIMHVKCVSLQHSLPVACQISWIPSYYLYEYMKCVDKGTEFTIGKESKDQFASQLCGCGTQLRYTNTQQKKKKTQKSRRTRANQLWPFTVVLFAIDFSVFTPPRGSSQLIVR